MLCIHNTEKYFDKNSISAQDNIFSTFQKNLYNKGLSFMIILRLAKKKKKAFGTDDTDKEKSETDVGMRK